MAPPSTTQRNNRDSGAEVIEVFHTPDKEVPAATSGRIEPAAARIFGRHKRGLFALPEDVTQAFDAHHTLETMARDASTEAQVRLKEGLRNAEADAVRATVAAALRGDLAGYPDLTEVSIAEADIAAAERKRTHLARALTTAANTATSRMTSAGVTILETYLSDALTDVLTKAEERLTQLRANPDLLADGYVFDVTMRDLGEAYDAIRLAQADVYRLNAWTIDEAGPVWEFEDGLTFWPDFAQEVTVLNEGGVYGPTQKTPPPPWPTETVARILWGLENRATFWIPTPEDLERALNPSHDDGPDGAA